MISNIAPSPSAGVPGPGLVETTLPFGMVDEVTKYCGCDGTGSLTAEKPDSKSLCFAAATVRPATSGTTTEPPRLMYRVTRDPRITSVTAW